MRRILLAVAWLVAAGLLLGAGVARGPLDRCEPPSGERVTGSRCEPPPDAPLGALSEARPVETSPQAGGSLPRPGSGGEPAEVHAKVARRAGEGGGRGESGAPRAFAPGERPEAQAFLAVNGCANANGARA